jgi:non-ribosomal peptide synthetase component F
MARYSGQRDIAVGAVNAGRDRAELDGVAGFFVNTLVLRSWLDAEQPFTAFLDQVRATVLEAFAHDDVPFDQLVEELRPDRDEAILSELPAGSMRPKVEAAFNYVRATGGEALITSAAALETKEAGTKIVPASS